MKTTAAIRYEGFTPIVRVKAPNAAAAWQRVLHMTDAGKAPSWYDMKVTEIAPANAAGNATYDCRLLVGRD